MKNEVKQAAKQADEQTQNHDAARRDAAAVRAEIETLEARRADVEARGQKALAKREEVRAGAAQALARGTAGGNVAAEAARLGEEADACSAAAALLKKEIAALESEYSKVQCGELKAELKDALAEWGAMIDEIGEKVRPFLNDEIASLLAQLDGRAERVRSIEANINDIEKPGSPLHSGELLYPTRYARKENVVVMQESRDLLRRVHHLGAGGSYADYSATAREKAFREEEIRLAPDWGKQIEAAKRAESFRMPPEGVMR